MRAVSKYILPITVLIVGSFTAIFVTKTINDFENEQITEKYSANAVAHIATIKQTLNDNLNALSNIKAFYDSSKFVSRQEFKTLTSPYLLTHEHVQALEWIPVVKHEMRKLYEMRAQNDGFAGFSFKQRDADGHLVKEADKSTYYPVFYVEPLGGNEAALGFDLGSNEARLSALNQAIDTGFSVATAPINLVQETKNQPGVLAFIPIYNHQQLMGGVATSTVEERRANIKGFGLLVLRVGDLIYHSIDHFHTQNIVLIDDITDPKNIQNLYDLHQEVETSYDLKLQDYIDVAGRTWRITIYPERGSYLLNSDPWLWLILVLGIFLTFILTYYLVQMINREDIINQQVALKTAELADSENKANMVLDTAVEGIITMDASGKIRTFNAAATELYGYQEDEIIGANYSLLIKDGAQLPEAELIEIISKLGRFVEVKGLKSDGTSFAGELTHSKYTVAGKVMYSFFVRDISRRKKMEAEQAVLIDQLNESNGDLQRFAYVASHDLQEPLRMVRNFTELLEKEYGASLDENAASYMKISSDAAKRMQNLVTDLLDFSKIGKGQDFVESIDCEKIINYIQVNLNDNISRTGAQFKVEKMPTIIANTSMFTRLLQNLISNSVKYRNSKTKPVIEISAQQQDDNWVFCVKDNGIGIEKQYFEQIFEPFQRLHTRSEYRGSGIGLAICARIIDKMKGRIWVESEYGIGTSFYFEIPKIDQDDNLSETNS